jgi:CheY-like chemotaxis protein
MLRRTLAAEGYEVASAPDGGAALASIERSAPELVVLDISMPGLVRALWVCAIYVVVPTVAAYLVFLRRDVAGEG